MYAWQEIPYYTQAQHTHNTHTHNPHNTHKHTTHTNTHTCRKYLTISSLPSLCRILRVLFGCRQKILSSSTKNYLYNTVITPRTMKIHSGNAVCVITFTLTYSFSIQFIKNIWLKL